MQATFDDLGNLVLQPETSLERMACSAFLHAMHRRSKPSVIVSGVPAPLTSTQIAELLAKSAKTREIAGQTKLTEVLTDAPR